MYAIAGPLGVKVLMCVVEVVWRVEVEKEGYLWYMYGMYLHCCVVGRVGIMALSGSARQVPGSLPRRTGRGQW